MQQSCTSKLSRQPSGRKRYRFRLKGVWKLVNPLSLAIVLALSSSGCTADYYRRSADSEAKGILRHKAGSVANVDGDVDLSIEPPPPISLEDLKKNAGAAEFLGKAAKSEIGGRVVPLEDALELAINYNRTYVAQKEMIYLQTLELTLARHELAPIFSGAGSATRGGDRSGGGSGGRVEAGDGGGDGTLANAGVTTAEVESAVGRTVSQNTLATNSNLGFSMLQRSGARLAADFTTDFLKFLGGGRSVNNSALVVSLTQPLLRGAGYKATMENLTQAERDLLYSVRDFATFRREFIVGIAERYYRVLLARDQVRNNWVGYEGFRVSVVAEQNLFDGGRSAINELGQLKQAALQAESAWVNAISDYQRQLDELKIELGISVDTPIVLKDDGLSELKIIDPKVSLGQAQEIALGLRPDLWSAVDRVEDAERRIEVAKIDLRPGLDIVGGYEVLGPTTSGTPKLDLNRRNWSAGLDVDLGFDRKEQRNNYRSAFVSLEQSKRVRDLALDSVRLQINNDWRGLAQAKRNYDINLQGIELAKSRLREQEIRRINGDAVARDIVEARSDLIDAQNAASSSLVDHTLARLRLWQDMGILYITEDGSWMRVLKDEGD